MKGDINAIQKSVVRLLVPTDEVDSFTNYDELRNWLIENIDWLLDNDFESLLSILYRIDVAESKVRRLIEQNEGKNPAHIISDLILERQAQKIESRKRYSQPKNNRYFDDVQTWD